MKLKKILNETYLIPDSNTDNVFNSLKTVALNLSGIRNDFIYLHINTFGLSFKTIHEKFDDYYNRISEDLDSILEIIGMYSKDHEAIPLDLNDNAYVSNKSEWLRSEENLVYAGRDLIENILNTLEVARKTVSKNEGIASDLDSIASYWTKEHAYILKRFVS